MRIFLGDRDGSERSHAHFAMAAHSFCNSLPCQPICTMISSLVVVVQSRVCYTCGTELSLTGIPSFRVLWRLLHLFGINCYKDSSQTYHGSVNDSQLDTLS